MNKKDVEKVEITSGDIKAEQIEQLKPGFLTSEKNHS
jgi:hypothetical protein